MFKLENTKKLKTLLGLGLSVFLATSLFSANGVSIDGAVKYEVKDGKYGPYHLNMQDTKKYDNGRKATKLEVKVWNLDVRPDGEGLPMYDMKHGKPVMENGKPKIAQGSVEWGEELYDAQCAMCHGEFGAGGKGYPTLAGGSFKDLHIQRLNPADENPNPDVALKTIGSYWPYASTLYWYIQESMPFTAPKTLTNSETYAITAFLLASNGIEVDGEEMDEEFVLSKSNFNKIVMPNVEGFYPEVDTKDPHQGPKNMQKLLSDPTIYGKGTRCMKDCIKQPVEDLLLRIKVDLIPNVNEPLSTERSWKEPVKATASDVDPVIVDNYATYCSACHANKAIGAPVLGDKEAWAEVMEKGLEEVYTNGIDGINAMPPKGTAMGLSDDEFKQIVDYIINESK
ncbi:c-type cytochrome [Arcobacter sp. LA11]|uniref:c-type cytochrome n=1 Tax=Arcobacter sp. LA11 TaxID=1898176 RepID=UPI0009331C56|nr:c-type cytochrome [Arcobacter sp. LA11]